MDYIEQTILRLKADGVEIGKSRASRHLLKLIRVNAGIKSPGKITAQEVTKALREYAALGVCSFGKVKKPGENYKPLRWPTKKEESDYMEMRQKQNVSMSANNPNENWMARILKKHSGGARWDRQYKWGYRIFDFFSMKLGIAIEVDGAEHKESYDSFRDVHNFLRSGIVVLRVRNKNEGDAMKAVAFIENSDTRKERRRKLAASAPLRKELVSTWRSKAFDGKRLLNDVRELGRVPVDLSIYRRSTS